MNEPTARKAASLITDSAAMASISPCWCSVASACRVPNRMANNAMAPATINAVSTGKARLVSASAPRTVSTDNATAFNCKAIYGSELITATTVTTAATDWLLP